VAQGKAAACVEDEASMDGCTHDASSTERYPTTAAFDSRMRARPPTARCRGTLSLCPPPLTDTMCHAVKASEY